MFDSSFCVTKLEAIDTFFFVNISYRNSLIFEVFLFSWHREQANWMAATTDKHSKESDGNSPRLRISVVNSSAFFCVWNYLPIQEKLLTQPNIAFMTRSKQQIYKPCSDDNRFRYQSLFWTRLILTKQD